MIRMTYDNLRQRGDVVLSGGHYETGHELETAVLISLFTERRAQPGDEALGRAPYKGGWWADSVTNDPLGSRLWLLRRAKATTDTLAQARAFALESLAWLLADGVARSVEVEAQRLRKPSFDFLGLVVMIIRPDGTAWSRAWEVGFNEL